MPTLLTVPLDVLGLREDIGINLHSGFCLFTLKIASVVVVLHFVRVILAIDLSRAQATIYRPSDQIALDGVGSKVQVAPPIRGLAIALAGCSRYALSI
jgi:hypothetical protein